MIRADIMRLEAGDETDALIAKHVMKLEVINGYVFEFQRIPCPDGLVGCLVAHYGKIPVPIPKYSSDISAAFEVLSKIHSVTGKVITILIGAFYHCGYDNGETMLWGDASTLPLAVSRFALLFVMGEPK